MGINRKKVLEAQADLSEKVLHTYNTISLKPLRKHKVEDIIKTLGKYQTEFDANHEKLMADGIGEEDYFIKDVYNNTVIKIEEIVKAINTSSPEDKSLIEKDKTNQEVHVQPHGIDQKTSIFMKKIEN